MPNRIRIYIERDADRDTIGAVLLRNGYTVRQGREKQGNKYVRYVEYWKGEAE
jgi:hypothetical protein